jgi:hypothetical protein
VRKIRFAQLFAVLSIAMIFPFVASARREKSTSKIGIGVKVSTLGVGVEAAVPVLHKLNIRAGGNFINYSQPFHKDGVTYNGSLSWRSGEASVDWFPFGGFHLSPGLLFYNGNKVTANALVPGGNNFTLNGTTYTSETTNPITGTGQVTFTKVAPKFTVGFGNLVPRNGRHWSILGEFGIAYQGSPTAALGFQGGACNQTQTTCVNAATDPTVQSNVAAEQTKINNSLSLFKFYPIISVGFGFNF